MASETVPTPLTAEWFAERFIRIRGAHNPTADELDGEQEVRPCAWCRLAGEQAAEAADAARREQAGLREANGLHGHRLPEIGHEPVTWRYKDGCTVTVNDDGSHTFTPFYDAALRAPAGQPAAPALDVERLAKALYVSERPSKEWPTWEEYLASFGHDLTIDQAWRLRGEKVAAEYARLAAVTSPKDGWPEPKPPEPFPPEVIETWRSQMESRDVDPALPWPDAEVMVLVGRFLATIDAARREQAGLRDLLREAIEVVHQTEGARRHHDPTDKTGWNVKGIETCADPLCVASRAALAAVTSPEARSDG